MINIRFVLGFVLMGLIVSAVFWLFVRIQKKIYRSLLFSTGFKLVFFVKLLLEISPDDFCKKAANWRMFVLNFLNCFFVKDDFGDCRQNLKLGKGLEKQNLALIMVLRMIAYDEGEMPIGQVMEKIAMIYSDHEDDKSVFYNILDCTDGLDQNEKLEGYLKFWSDRWEQIQKNF